MHYFLKLSSSANPDLNFWLSKLSKNSVLGVQMTRWTHRWLSPWPGIKSGLGNVRRLPVTCGHAKYPFSRLTSGKSQLSLDMAKSDDGQIPIY